MKSKTVLPTILLVCILAAAAFLYWTRTPQYSMLKLTEAVHNHDGVSFRNYFDINSVAANAVGDLTTEELRQTGGSLLLRRLFGIAIAGLFKPQMTETLAKNISNFVEKTPEQAAPDANGQTSQSSQAAPPQQAPSQSDLNSQSEEPSNQADQAQNSEIEISAGSLRRAFKGFIHEVVKAIKPPSLREVLGNMGLSKENFRGLTSFEVNGQLCHVGLKFQPPGKDSVIVMLELENVEEHWKVVRISNMDVLARNLTASSSP